MKYAAKKICSFFLMVTLVMGLTVTGMGEGLTDAERERDKKSKLMDELSMTMEEMAGGDVKITIKTAPFSRTDLQNQIALTYDTDAFSCSREDIAISDELRNLSMDFMMSNIMETKGQVRFAFFKIGEIAVDREMELMTVVFHRKTITGPVKFDLYYWFRASTGVQDKWLVDTEWYNMPEPSETPTQSPEPSEIPTQSPEPSETPTQSPEPSETPTQSPEPSGQPDIPQTEAPLLYGELNGDARIQVDDALCILNIVVKNIQPTELQKMAADLDGDGRISSRDALCILKKCADPSYKFPVEEEITGND